MRSVFFGLFGSAILLLGSLGCADIGGGDDSEDPDASSSCPDPITFYSDRDGDQFGDPGQTRSACAQPTGYVSDGTDCDDQDEAAHPGAADVCNDADDDCNGFSDDGECEIGCADGEREGFVDLDAQPNIAGCSGGFAIAGLLVNAPPACGRGAGDDSDVPDGAGCNATDLCGSGWHVCATVGQVASSGGTCAGSTPLGAPPLFFATRQSGPGSLMCGAGANDLFGCGSLGLAPGASCTPLDRFSNDLCAALGAPWSCGADNVQEATNVTKPGPDGGGVLCCRD